MKKSRPSPIAAAADDASSTTTGSTVVQAALSPGRRPSAAVKLQPTSSSRSFTPPRNLHLLRRQHTDTEVELTYEEMGTPRHGSGGGGGGGRGGMRPSKSGADLGSSALFEQSSPDLPNSSAALSPAGPTAGVSPGAARKSRFVAPPVAKSTSLHMLHRQPSDTDYRPSSKTTAHSPAVRDAFLIERCDRLPQRFAPILLTHTVSHDLHSEGQNAWSAHSTWWAKAKRMVGGAFLIGRLHVENLHIWIGVYHFVPLIIVLLAMTVNLLLHVMMGLLFPLIAHTVKANPTLSTASTLPDAGVEAARVYIESMVTAGLVFGGGATVGYKLMAVIGDAAIDMCRLVQHPTARVEMSYFVLFTQLRQLWRCGWVGGFFFLLFVALECVLGVFICFSPYFGIEWSGRDRNVFYVALAITAVQGVWVAFQAVRLALAPSGLSEDAVAVWWSRKLPRAQRRATLAIIVAGIGFTVDSGAVYGVTCIAEGLVYLNFVHVFTSIAARLALFTVRMLQSIRVVVTDPIARWAAGVFATPLVLVIIANTVLVRSPIVSLLQVPPLMLFIDSLCQHTHEHRGQLAKVMRRSKQHAASNARAARHGTLRHGGSGANTAEDGARVSHSESAPAQATTGGATVDTFTVATVFWIGLKSIFITQSKNFMREAHYGPRSTLRTILRLTLAVLIFIEIALGAWVSLQLDPQFAGHSQTRCEQLSPTSIRVVSEVLETELYLLDGPPSDPDSLIYEEEQHRYDHHRYQGICQRRWAGNLHAADLAYFSAMVYLETDSEDFDRMMRFYKRMRQGGHDWELVNITQTRKEQHPDDDGEELLDRAVSATFHHFRSKSQGTSVIAIRGTDQEFARDFLQNVLIFSEVVLFQLISFWVPGASLLPESLVRDFIRIASMMDVAAFDFDVRRDRHHYYREVERYVATFAASAAKENRRENFILTGHSLGGVVAQIVAARMRYPGVAFSSPGIALMDRKFGVDPDALDAYITNVVLSNDFLWTVGKLGGSVTHMQCEHQRPAVCHSIDLQTIRLWSTCAAYRQVTAINGSYRVRPQLHRTWMNSTRDAVLRLFASDDL